MLLILAAAQASAVDAERAFAADARKLGQWTAFRKWAAEDAIMFLPQPSQAQAWLKDRADPSVSVAWEPVQVWQSCDGTVAVTTGYAHWPNKSVGWFTTVWRRQADGGWRWVLDHGDILGPQTLGRRWFESHSINCRRKVPKLPRPVTHGYERPGGGGRSADGTLRYHWTADPGSGPGRWSHDLRVELWTGKDWKAVLNEGVAEAR